MSMLAASIRKTGPLGAKIERIRAERIAAGLLQDDEKQKTPVVLISHNGGKLVEESKAEAPAVRAPVIRRVLADEVKPDTEETNRCPSISSIIDVVTAYYSLSDDDFFAKHGSMTAKTARLMAAHICKTMTVNSFQSIGRRLGGRDHSTILKGLKRFEKKLARDGDLAADLSRLVYRINALTYGGKEMISDATQLAALQMAIDLAYERTKLNASQRELFQLQIDAIRKRIVEAAARRETKTEASK